MRDRPAPQFAKSLPSEKKISLAEAERGIYIDFEGFMKEAPALIGILVEDSFEQLVLDAKFLGAAAYKDPKQVKPGQLLVSDLLARSLNEERRIVAFSTLEKEQCMRWYGIDISQRYVNAKSVAGRWARKVNPEVRCRTLRDFEIFTGYRRSRDTGYQKIRAASMWRSAIQRATASYATPRRRSTGRTCASIIVRMLKQ